MFPMTIPDFLLTMATGMFLMGLICLATGMFLLVARAAGKDMHVLANQTTKLAQKGIAEDISGLVGNAGALVGSLNQLVRTTAGIGIFLVLVALILMGSAYYLITQIG